MAKSLPDLRIKAGERAQSKLQEILGEGSGIKTRVLHGNAASEILGLAAREGVDCIVIASHKPGFADYFLGSTAARVVRHAQCSVHVIR